MSSAAWAAPAPTIRARVGRREERLGMGSSWLRGVRGERLPDYLPHVFSIRQMAKQIARPDRPAAAPRYGPRRGSDSPLITTCADCAQERITDLGTTRTCAAGRTRPAARWRRPNPHIASCLHASTGPGWGTT